MSLYLRRKSSSLPLASAAICAGLAEDFAMNDDHNLILITALFAGLTVIFYVVKEFVSPAVRNRKLKTRPVDLFFVITSADRYDLGYAIQDEEQHRTLDLVVPANRDDLYLQIIFEARLSF